VSLDETEAVVRARLRALRGASPGTRLTGSPPTCWKNSRCAYEQEEPMARSSSVWQFYELLSQKAGMAHAHAIRYAWHVGNMLGDAVPEEVEAACEELSPEYRELSQRVLKDPHY
jgi:hypothetical protein